MLKTYAILTGILTLTAVLGCAGPDDDPTTERVSQEAATASEVDVARLAREAASSDEPAADQTGTRNPVPAMQQGQTAYEPVPAEQMPAPSEGLLTDLGPHNSTQEEALAELKARFRDPESRERLLGSPARPQRPAAAANDPMIAYRTAPLPASAAEPTASVLAGASPNLDGSETLTDDATAAKLANLQDIALYGPSSEVKLFALKALAQSADRKSPEVVSTLSQALLDEDVNIRQETLSAIYRNGIPIANQALHDVALNDPVDSIRAFAYLTLADFGGAAVQDYMRTGLQDPNPEIQQAAQRYFDELESPSQ